MDPILLQITNKCAPPCSQCNQVRAFVMLVGSLVQSSTPPPPSNGRPSPATGISAEIARAMREAGMVRALAQVGVQPGNAFGALGVYGTRVISTTHAVLATDCAQRCCHSASKLCSGCAPNVHIQSSARSWDHMPSCACACQSKLSPTCPLVPVSCTQHALLCLFVQAEPTCLRVPAGPASGECVP